MSRDPKSPLLKKRALDALLDSMADGLDGHDNYDELGAHRRGESTPEQKGTEFNNMDGEGFSGSEVVIPSKDLTPPSGPANAEFFKESEPKHAAEEKLPSKNEILSILRKHPLVQLEEDPTRVFVIGSVARGEQRPDSDIDILLEVPGGGQQLTDWYRRKLQQHFVDNDLHGKHDEVHPQWNGRRVDVYTTSNADADERPKIKIGSMVYRSSPESNLGLQSMEDLIKEVQNDSDDWKAKEGAGKPVATSNPQSLKNIRTEIAEIKDAVKWHLKGLVEEQGMDIDIHDILFTGSRLTGNIHDESDLDVVVIYDGDIREDDLFNMANDPNLEIDDVPVDINPIKADRRGELEQAGMIEKEAAPIEEEMEGHEFFKESDEAAYQAIADKYDVDFKGVTKTPGTADNQYIIFNDTKGSGTQFGLFVNEFTPELFVERLNAARARFGMKGAKTAGHRAKDTGEYDESREAKIRKIAQETAQYAERGATFDPKGEYLCNGCHYMLGNEACAFVEGDISKEHGTCRYWKIADGKAPVELERKYDKKNAGYAERKDQPFGCSRCEYGFKAKEADSSGRESWCEFFGMHIEPNACCNENNLHGDEHFNVDNSINKQGTLVQLKTAAKTLYHVTNTATVPAIKAKGILPLQTSNWVKGPEGDRYGEGEIFAMDNPVDAIRWAAKMDWEFNKGMGTGKISIIAFTPGAEKWKTDSSDPISQGQNKGKWLKAIGSIKPEQITGAHVLEPEMVKSVVQGKDVKLGEIEKEADVPTKSYGMGTPIGGTDNPDAGASDEPDELNDPGELSLDMTSSLEEDDPEAENDRIYAMLDEEDERSERMHTASAKRLDNAAFTVASFKIASMTDVGWFTKSARPTEQKLELLQKQLKLTPEQLELCIAVDPSPNQSDFVAWIAKQFAKGAFQLPEDTEKIKGQLENFQKLKKSPAFTFSKDIQQYDAAKLFETLETAATTMQSKKEQQRDVVTKGAEVVVNEGDIKIYKVTEPRAAMQLGGGTNWCTVPQGNTMAATYLKDGPLYIFFDGGSAVAQLHCESNQFMNRQDVCILETVTGDAEYGRDLKKFLSDPGMLKALQMLAAKEVKVATWVQDNIADPGEVSKILGEAAAQETEYNTGFEKEVAEYEQQMVEFQKKYQTWEKKMKKLQPEFDKYYQDYDAYRAKMDEYHKTDGAERPEAPIRPTAPDKPYAPRDPRIGDSSYGYRGYENKPRGKKFTMQVRAALASGVPLAPEIEAQLVGLNTQLLIKYGVLFHPGQPWEPLAQTILAKLGEKGKVDKEAVDYAAKFVKGRWEPLEPYLLNKLFLVTNNMENMRTCLDYAFRAYRQRWPEFEDKIAKAKPGAASGYGAAQYAIRVLKKPWSAFPDIKRKKNGKINAEECMIVGNPGEARVYAEAFNSGKSWDAFEESALAANNLAALINYAEGQNRRMPELEEKILSGERDAQESKGRQRHRQHTDLPLDYSLKVIKGRWPEYEAKILEAINKAPKSTGYNSGEYKPSHGEYGYGEGKSRLDKRIQNYIKQVIKGRWPDAEQALLARYSEYPGSWSTNQDLVDGYLVIINKACQERHKDDEEVPEPEGNEAVRAEGQHAWQVPKRKDERRQKPFTKFQQDVECYWPEGESRLITRDAGYEKILVDELRRRAVPTSEADKNSYTKEEKYVSIEDLATMERPGGDISYEEKEKKPSYTIWNGIWIGWYGMDTIEKYVDYMLSNGQTWKEGVDIMEVAEDLEDVRGRWNHNTRPLRRPEQKAEQKAREEAEMMERTREMHGLSPVQSSAERFQQRFTSSLLKKALIDIEPAPSLLPPRDDLKGHMDEQMHDQMTKEVMKGVREPLNPKKKNRRPQIDPRINPDGVVASVDGKSEIRIRLRGKEEIIPVAPQDIMKAVRQAENLSMANPGFPVVFILDEEGVITEDTYINGNHVGDTVEKFGAMEEDKDFAMSGKTGPFYRIDTMDWNDLAAYHGKRFADAVQAGKKVTVYRAGKPGETLVPNTFLSANKNMARSYQHESTESFGGPVMYRYEVDPKDLLHVENFEASELVYKPRTKTSAEYTQQDADDDATTEIWLDQVSDSEDEAKRFFMQENYLQQIAQDDGINMEQLWDKMGKEYIAEFYGYPYKRVPDFTDEATKGLEEKEEPQELRLSGS